MGFEVDKIPVWKAPIEILVCDDYGNRLVQNGAFYQVPAEKEIDWKTTSCRFELSFWPDVPPGELKQPVGEPGNPARSSHPPLEERLFQIHYQGTDPRDDLVVTATLIVSNDRERLGGPESHGGG